MGFCCCGGEQDTGGEKGEGEPQPRLVRAPAQDASASVSNAQASHQAKDKANARNPATGGSNSPPAKGDLWYRAYAQCYTRKHEGEAKLLDELEKTLLAKASPGGANKLAQHKSAEERFKALNNALKSSLPVRVKEVEDHTWSIPFTNGQVDIGDAVETFVEVMAKVKDFVGGALAADPTASLAWSGICFGIQFVKNPIQGRKELLESFDVVTEMMHRYLTVEGMPQMKGDSNLKTATIELYRLILVFQAEALRHLTRLAIGRVWSDTLDPTHWSDMVKKIRAQEDVCDKIITRDSHQYIIDNRRGIDGLRSEVEKSFKKQLEVLQSLETLVGEFADEGVLNTTLDSRRVGKASHKADKRRCLAGTRSTILADVLTWAASEEPAEKWLFWIAGMAGTGKSTVAATVAEQSARWQGHTVISFFFSRNEANRGNTDHLVPTLAMQLVDCSDLLKGYICKAMRANHTLFEQPVDEQWKSLIQEPFQELEKANQGAFAPPTVLVVIDGLDECSQDAIRHVVSMLSKLRDISCARFRALVTSRPWIEPELADLKPVMRERNLSSERDVTPEEIDSDIRKYYEHRLAEIRKGYCNRAHPSVAAKIAEELGAWPTDELVEQLVRKTDRLFQYATVACNVAEHDPSGDSPAVKIQAILQSGIAEGLDALYATALSRAAPEDGDLERDRDVFFRRFRLIVGTILFSLEPLSSNDVVSLLEAEHGFKVEVVSQFVWRLRSVLSVPDTNDEAIKSVHLSLGELLSSEERCSNVGLLKFHVSEADIHERLFRSCTGVLDSWVPWDYDADQIMIRIFLEETYEDRSIPSQVRYACLFWTAHCQGALTAYAELAAEQAASVLADATTFAERRNQVWMAVLCFLREPEAARKSAVFLENMLDNIDASFNADRLRQLEDIPRSVFEDLEYYQSSVPTDIPDLWG